jgi:hypothetical protein
MFLGGIYLLLLFMSGFFKLSLALPADESPFGQLLHESHYDVVPLLWTGTIIDGGPEYELNGTAEVSTLPYTIRSPPRQPPLLTQVSRRF